MVETAETPSNLKAHQFSVRLEEPLLVLGLEAMVGSTGLVSYLGSVKETRAVRQWINGERKPSAEVMVRLRHAYHVAAILAEWNSSAVVQAWFQGMNPYLDDAVPATLLREAPVEDAQRVLAAARAFAAAK